MIQKNEGPCAIYNCNKETRRFRRFTPLAYKKACEKGTYTSYRYLKVGQQICHIHYMNIVENSHSVRSQIVETNEQNDIDSMHLYIYIFQ
jgi:hypothetical protein